MTEAAAEATTETAPATESLITDAPAPIDFTTGKPEGFPDDFWDAEKNAPLTDKLFTSWQNEKKRADGLRVKLSKGEFEGKAPEDIAEYKLALTEEDGLTIPEDDTLLIAARNAAKEAGLPADMFAKFTTPIVKEMARLQAELAKGPSAEEIAAAKSAEIAKLGPTGEKITQAVGSWVNELTSGGVLSEAEAVGLKESLTTAEAVRAINKLRMMNAPRDAVPLEVPIDAKASMQDIQRKLSEAIMKGDEQSAAKYTAMLNK